MGISYSAEKRRDAGELLNYAYALGEMDVPLVAWDNFESYFSDVLCQIGNAVYSAVAFERKLKTAKAPPACRTGKKK
jgi:hypothetical protein